MDLSSSFNKSTTKAGPVRMPGTPNFKDQRVVDKHLQRTRLEMPAIGMESEFNVWIDEIEVDPREYWGHPGAFIDRPLLPREKSSLQLPTGGAVYFDRGVIEVVTPVIELAPHSTARMVRNLWEQIGFVRDQLTKWEKANGHTVRLKAYSSHYNISYEIPKRQQSAKRNEKLLALLLTYILPVPVMLVASNRRSTGVGVRPRGGRIEVTVDFTPDPGLMVAAATLIVGIVREVMSWPTYDLSILNKLPIPVVAGVVPGKHTTRKGWLTKDFHYPQSPYTSDINAPIWKTQHGQTMSLRTMAARTAWFFRHSIRKYSDPFSMRLLFAILSGRAPSLLELIDRPAAYDDVGHLCRWGSVIHELKNYETELGLIRSGRQVRDGQSIDEYVVQRATARQIHLSALETVADAKFAAPPPPVRRQSLRVSGNTVRRPSNGRSRASLSRRQNDTPGKLLPARPSQYVDRRGTSLMPSDEARERRRASDRRKRSYNTPFPDRRLTRSAYEQVFLKLVSGGKLRMGDDLYSPIGMKGWLHAIFRCESDGTEKLLSIDQLLQKMSDWT
ncbi:MAG: hypothetical protein QOE82_2921 [Thermoanaerobaculia bacterium]|jgi:hypothetical protein|nr:hypothetical protein [Thermoanaerobaculia bacterium]